MKSLWYKKNNFKILNKKIETDILIVGAGITGITLNYLLNKENVVVIDTMIGETTLKSTAKINYLQDILLKIDNKYLKLYLESQKEAVKKLKKIIIDNKIDCDLTSSSSVLFTNNNKEADKIKNLIPLLKNNFDNNLTFNSLYNIAVHDCYVFNPGKYLKGLINVSHNNFYKNRYLNHQKINGKYVVNLDNGKTITCNKIVFACNYPPFIIPFLAPLKFRIEKSYLHVYEKQNIPINAINTKKPFISYRYYKNNKILLLNSHLNGTILDNEKMFLNSNIKWSNCDLITYDYMPFIGEIKENIYISTGYNTWGMTNGTLGAYIICDLINTKKNKYSDLFNPKRSIKLLPTISNAFINGFLFTKSLFKKNYNFYKNVYVTYIDNKRCGVYIDENNKKHIVLNKCPHMKCNLVFNEVEKTWDCPCHASRFDIDGNVLRGPSVYNIKMKDK